MITLTSWRWDGNPATKRNYEYSVEWEGPGWYGAAPNPYRTIYRRLADIGTDAQTAEQMKVINGCFSIRRYSEKPGGRAS